MTEKCGFGFKEPEKKNNKDECKGNPQFIDMSIYGEGCDW